MRDRRCKRPRDDYLNRFQAFTICSWLVLVTVAGSTHSLPFDEFLVGGDETAHGQPFSQQRQTAADFFGSSFGQQGGYSAPAAPTPPPKEVTEEAAIPSPRHGGQDGGEHFEAPNAVPFEGRQDEDGANPEWEILSHSSYTDPVQYTEYDLGSFPDYSAYGYDDENFSGGGGGGTVKTDEKRPAASGPEEIAAADHHDMSREDLEDFLSQFYLIKTQHGYILGRSLPPAEVAFPPPDFAFHLPPSHPHLHPHHQPSSSQAQQHYQQWHRGNSEEPREELTKRKSNFQLRVRKRYDPSIFFNRPAAAATTDKRARDFQLRVRRGGEDTGEKRASNFQLRVRKGLMDRLEKRGRSFQLRVRKSDDDSVMEEAAKRRNFQLRVRKDDDDNNDDNTENDVVKRARNFQLRVRKSGARRDRFLEEAKRGMFQLRVRKAEEDQEEEEEDDGHEQEKRGRNFQLRVRKDDESAAAAAAENIDKKSPRFQLRVRRQDQEVQRRAPNFQLRVRRGRDFQLRVRRRGSDNTLRTLSPLRVSQPLWVPQSVVNKRGGHNFQLRVRKEDPTLTPLNEETVNKRVRSFQLRVRKKSNNEEEVSGATEEGEAAAASLVGWLPDKRASHFQLRVRKAEEDDRGWGQGSPVVRKRNWQRPLRRSSSFQLRVRKKSLLPVQMDKRGGLFQLRV